MLIFFFFSFFFFLNFQKSTVYSSIIGSIISNAVLTVFSSEFLSLFNEFNFQFISLFWGIIDGLLFLNLIQHKDRISSSIQKIRFFFQSFKSFRIAYIILIFLFLLFIQGLVYPPNNWDSLTYHMGRIPHWVENQNIYPFASHIYRQVYSPPLAELIVAHFCILNKADFLANSIQLVYLIGCLATILAIANEFQFSKRVKIICCVFVITTPEILLQATSTQNDIIVSFYLLAAILFAIKTINKNSISNLLFFSICSGLAIFTKGTAYIFLLPIIIVWTIFFLRKNKNFLSFMKVGLVALFILLINSGLYFRNFSLTADPLGKNEEHLFNERFDVKSTFMTTIKNIGNHLGVYPINSLTNQVVEKIQLVIGEKIDDPKTNFNGLSFKLEEWQHHEDTASNFFQIILILFCTVIILINRKKYPPLVLLLLGIPIIEFVLFCFILKWQPWHTRLQPPIFFMSAFFVAICLDRQIGVIKSNSIKFILPSTILFIYAFIIILFNPSRPFITNHLTKDVYLTDTRFKKYCANFSKYEMDYKTVRNYLKKHKGKVGLELGGDMWEYLLYYDVFSTNEKLAYPINIANISSKLQKNEKKDFDYIISFQDSSTFKYQSNSFHKIKKLKLFSFYSKTK